MKGAKDAPAPRPNKRPRLGPSPVDEPVATLNVEKTDAKGKSKADSQFDKYMEVMQPRTKKGPSWANEATAEASTAIHQPAESQNVEMADVAETSKEEGMSDLDWMKRRMSEKVDNVEKAFEQSDDEGDGEKTQVRLNLSFDLSIFNRPAGTPCDEVRATERPSHRDYTSDSSSVCSQSSFFVHGCRPARAL